MVIEDQEEASIGAQGKCTRQLAQIAARNAKFLSSQLKAGLFTAETAIRSTRNTKLILSGFSCF